MHMMSKRKHRQFCHKYYYFEYYEFRLSGVFRLSGALCCRFPNSKAQVLLCSKLSCRLSAGWHSWNYPGKI